MVHIYIGDGKGKTTAALGLTLRALGWGKRVYIAQFLKDTKLPCGEIEAIEKCKLKIKIEKFKNQIHPICSKGKKIEPRKIEESVKKALVKVEDCIDKKEFDLIVLDEILNVWEAGFLAKEKLKQIIAKAKNIEIVLTGRSAPSDLIKLADYVSLIKKLKHPFDKKIFARSGIEY